MIKIKKIYHRPRNNGWTIIKRSGDRAELHHYYKSKMNYIRKVYEIQDYIMLDLSLNKLKQRSIYYAKRGLGFAVNKELFEMIITLFRFEGYDKYADILIRNTPEEFFKPLITNNEQKENHKNES
ncbi:hypothetical protein [Anaerofustis stercorihominis]|uniref:Uncharacterized protein n=1 Tax=Anaerofustis stercorihominis TaxID=214853 RepID=A0A3E3E157_9FIRM|nr:hypothetical protein [Anaerofustis stercorihominis]RGD74668.1 hypothetical protein DW687_07885 [Anaerofustis stercorihominis]